MTVTERGYHHRIEELVEVVLDETGHREWQTNRYTVLSPGMHFLENGEWQESEVRFEALPGGGWAALRGSHQVVVSENLQVAGAIQVTSAEGVRWRSTPLQLLLHDTRSGQSAVLGELQASFGEQVEANVILFRNAFRWFSVDVRVVYRADGVECDVILRARLPRPEFLALDPLFTDLLVQTEVFDVQPTALEAKERMVFRGDSLEVREDSQVEFGSLRLAEGSAFQFEDRPVDGRGQVPAFRASVRRSASRR